ncbi:MAG TPA: hypothetical protein VGK33_12305, partial [Chloroflexota bacterium]
MRGHALFMLIVVALLASAIPADRALDASPVVHPATVDLASSQPVAEAAPITEDAASVADSATDALVQPGQQLVRRGDYAQAEQFYADLATQDPSVAPRALLLEARATLADGDTDGAEVL